MGEHEEAVEPTVTSIEQVAPATVHRIGEGMNEIAVFEFQGELRRQLLDSLRRGYLETGRYTSDARTLAPQTMLSMVTTGSAVAGTAASAAFSGSLFMATAAPSSLMQIGSGVGSAVIGSGGIVAHAPFIAVASSLPVVAPFMAMQALNAAVMLQQFKRVDRKLDTIKQKLDEAVARSEATITAELVSASNIADEVYRQFEATGHFSTDMLIRLALAERDVRRVALRAQFLTEAHTVAIAEDIDKVHQANYDARSAMLASFLELRIAYLRLCVDMQENPKSVPGSVEQLQGTLGDGVELWQRLLTRSSEYKAELDKVRTRSNDRNPILRKLAPEKALKSLDLAHSVTMESELKIYKGFDALIQDATNTLDTLKVSASPGTTPPTLLYWEDESGAHSMYTDKMPLHVSGD